MNCRFYPATFTSPQFIRLKLPQIEYFAIFKGQTRSIALCSFYVSCFIYTHTNIFNLSKFRQIFLWYFYDYLDTLKLFIVYVLLYINYKNVVKFRE